MGKLPTVVGIDLGTTHSSVVAIDQHQAPFLIPLSPPHHTVPTAVFYPDIEAEHREIALESPLQCVIGAEAHTRYLEDPSRGAMLFKRRMGELSWYLQIDQETLSAETLARHYLYQLRKQSEIHVTDLIQGAVVTVPAYFPDAGRRSTSRAAEAAGWPLLGLLNEPTAAALAHGYHYNVPGFDLGIQHQPHHHASGDCILVFDLGGGTLDLSVLLATDDQLQVLASCGDTALGCQDWDNAMVEAVAESFTEQFHWNPLEYPDSYERLRRVCQDTREQLSQQQQVILHFHQHQSEFSQPWTQTRLSSLCDDLLVRCRELIRKTLEESKTQASQIKRVLLAGGGSRMPMIIQLLHHYFDMAPDTSLDPARAVATGAALFARQLIQQPTHQQRTDGDKFLPGVTIQEVAPYPLGLLHLREKRLHYRPLFAKHSPLPAEVVLHDLTTSHDNQTTLELLLSQSTEASVSPEDLTAACRISGIPQRPAGQAEMEVTFTYNTRGLVEVHAKEKETQRPLVTSMLSTEELMQQIQTSTSRHILILVDTSASMEGRALIEAKYAIVKFLEVLEEHQHIAIQKVGLIRFGDQGVSLLSEPRHDFVYLRALVSQLSSSGKTPMAEALSLSLSTLKAHNDEDVQERLIVLVSDGLPNDPETAAQVAAELHRENIRVIAIGLGEKVDSAFLANQICTSADDYRNVADPIALPVTFASLAMELRWQS